MNPNIIRTDNIRKALVSESLDAVLVQLPENVLFLSGYWPMIGMSVLIFPASGKPVCIIPDCYKNEAESSIWETEPVYYSYGLKDSPDAAKEISRIVDEHLKKNNLKRIGLELTAGASAVSWNSAEFILPFSFLREHLAGKGYVKKIQDIIPLLQEQKRIKTAYETDKIRAANEAACTGLEAFYMSVRPGATGIEIVTDVEKAVMEKATLAGFSRVRAYAQVAVGAEETAAAYRPNEISTAHVLLDGELAVLELGVVVDGYWADRTMTAAAGKMSSMQKEIFSLVKEAQTRAVETVKAGVKACDVDHAARSVIEGAGRGNAFPHITGHGLGFAYHESSPAIKPGNPERLEAGMVHTVEPGVYIPGFGGIRIEDDILVTEDGAAILGPFQR